MAKVGAIVIGRNEGERLSRCLGSVFGLVETVIYVDSGSTDNSVSNARKLGANVVQLNLNSNFTAARARNAGFARLVELCPDVTFALFVDGDCELERGFLAKSLAVMSERSEVAVVCGRRRERFAHDTVYNLLCEIEWNTPVGDADACGGDALIRAVPFSNAGGYKCDLIAGEEPELCRRLRLAGHRIARIDADMTLHDAAMTKFHQWFKRSMRSGFAYASNYTLTKNGPLPIWRREYISNWFWGIGFLFLPVPCLAWAWWTDGISLLPLLIFAWLGWRIYNHRRGQGDSMRTARIYSAFTIIGKAPQALGQLKFHCLKWLDRRASLIEYK